MFLNIAKGVYCAGVITTSITTIIEFNKVLNKNYKNPSFIDCSVVSVGGLFVGGIMGLFFPVTLIGRISTLKDKTE